jgi:hypothetical protein
VSRYVSEWRTTAAGVRVHAYSICGTDCVVLAAYEPRAGHGTWMSGPLDEPLGVLSTRPCPPEIQALKMGSPERLAAIDAWLRAMAEESYVAIVEAFPEAAAGERRYNDIEMWGAASTWAVAS